MNSIANKKSYLNPLGLRLNSIRISSFAIALAVVCLFIADLTLTQGNPQLELKRLIDGFMTPTLSSINNLTDAIIKTISYALLSVSLSAVIGFFLATQFTIRLIRVTCAIIRSIHELFWALILLQIFGLHPLTGILAIAIPYTGIFAKIIAEIIEENQPPETLQQLSRQRFIRFLYTELPNAWPTIKSYTRYRFECALRASTVLGFVGLPTLGYALESELMEGHYSDVAGILSLLVVIIVSLRWWLQAKLLPIYLIASVYFVGDWQSFSLNVFFFSDLIPLAVKQDGVFALLPWGWRLMTTEGFSAVYDTLILAHLALVLTGIIAILGYPAVSDHFVTPKVKALSNIILATVRSIPEFLLTFIILIVTGPSMLPAILALAIHNGAIVSQLTGEHSSHLALPFESTTPINRFFYYTTPKVAGQFLAFLFYRWEVIIRETAILGMLGIHTLGFAIDSAFQDIRFDKAIFFILVTALINIIIDQLSSWMRNTVRQESKATTNNVVPQINNPSNQ